KVVAASFLVRLRPNFPVVAPLSGRIFPVACCVGGHEHERRDQNVTCLQHQCCLEELSLEHVLICPRILEHCLHVPSSLSAPASCFFPPVVDILPGEKSLLKEVPEIRPQQQTAEPWSARVASKAPVIVGLGRASCRRCKLAECYGSKCVRMREH
ncbi:unnamed protein product, partial [Phaeothamnion confervicola]